MKNVEIVLKKFNETVNSAEFLEKLKYALDASEDYSWILKETKTKARLTDILSALNIGDGRGKLLVTLRQLQSTEKSVVYIGVTTDVKRRFSTQRTHHENAKLRVVSIFTDKHLAVLAEATLIHEDRKMEDGSGELKIAKCVLYYILCSTRH